MIKIFLWQTANPDSFMTSCKVVLRWHVTMTLTLNSKKKRGGALGLTRLSFLCHLLRLFRSIFCSTLWNLLPYVLPYSHPSSSSWKNRYNCQNQVRKRNYVPAKLWRSFLPFFRRVACYESPIFVKNYKMSPASNCRRLQFKVQPFLLLSRFRLFCIDNSLSDSLTHKTFGGHYSSNNYKIYQKERRDEKGSSKKGQESSCLSRYKNINYNAFKKNRSKNSKKDFIRTEFSRCVCNKLNLPWLQGRLWVRLSLPPATWPGVWPTFCDATRGTASHSPASHLAQIKTRIN